MLESRGIVLPISRDTNTYLSASNVNFPWASYDSYESGGHLVLWACHIIWPPSKGLLQWGGLLLSSLHGNVHSLTPLFYFGQIVHCMTPPPPPPPLRNLFKEKQD